MLGIPSLRSAVAALALTVSSVGAAPTNKCMVNGTVTYRQGPCPSDQARRRPTLEELNAVQRKRRAAAAAAAPAKVTSAIPAVASSFGCDGCQYFSQMQSCAEAEYFLAAGADSHLNGTWLARRWFLSSASRAKGRSGSGLPAQT